MATGNVLDAVEEAVKTMELNIDFNAGFGSVLTRSRLSKAFSTQIFFDNFKLKLCSNLNFRDSEVQMDAIIMDGRTMDIGAVTAVQDIYHPITLARRVMEKIEYNFLGSAGAMKFAKDEGFKFLPPGTLVTDYSRDSLARWMANQGLNATGKRDVCTAL